MGLAAWLLAPYREGLHGLDRRVLVLVSGTFFFIAARIGLMTYLGIFFHRDLGLSLPLVGAAFLLENVARGLAAPLAGSLSDRIGRRPLLLASVLASAALMPGFLLVRDAATLVAWSGLVGFAQGGFFPSTTSLLLDLAPLARKQSVLALNYTALSVGYVVGVIPGGFLAGAGYPLLAVASSAAFAAVGLLAWLGLRGPLPATGDGPPTLLLPFRDGAFLTFAAISLIFPLSVGLIAIVTPVYAADAGGLPESTIGLVLSANGIVIALLTVPANVRLERRGPFRLLAVAALPLAAAYLILALGASIPLLLVGTVVFSLGEIVFAAAAPTAAAALAPAGARGAYQGAWALAFAVGVGGALALTGLLRDAAGWAAAWRVLAVVTLAAGAAHLALRGWFRRTAQARGAA